MSRKCPAIVECPANLHLRTRFDPGKKQFNIDIIAVDVVEPQQIGIEGFCPLQKSLSRFLGAKAVTVCQSSVQRMKFCIKVIPNSHGVFAVLLGNFSSAIGDLNGMAVFFEVGSEIGADPARASDATDRINE